MDVNSTLQLNSEQKNPLKFVSQATGEKCEMILVLFPSVQLHLRVKASTSLQEIEN